MAIDSATFPEEQPLPGQERQTPAKTVLIVAGDERLAGVLSAYFDREGYKVIVAEERHKAAEVYTHSRPDVVILDEEFQKASDSKFLAEDDQLIGPAIIILTGSSPPKGDRVQANLPGSDLMRLYLRPRELGLRVREALRRAGKRPPAAKVFQAGGIVIDRDRHFVRAADRYIDLTPTEFDILSVLISSPGQVFTRSELRELVWGIEDQASDRTIDVHVMNIRGKLGENLRAEPLIETIHRVGYRFNPG